MNTKNLLLLVCVLGFSSLAFADLDIIPYTSDHYNNIDFPDIEEYGCHFVLYSRQDKANSGGDLTLVRTTGPSYSGDIPDLNNKLSHSYHHNLHTLVYGGWKCDCTITLFQGPAGTGKSKDYPLTPTAGVIMLMMFDFDWCWGNKVESLAINCNPNYDGHN